MYEPYVEIDRNRRIRLRVPYYAGVAEDCKSIQGYKYEPDDKEWTFPLRMQTCHNLRQVFGTELLIGPQLTTWATRAAVKYRKQRSLASKPDSDLAKVKKSHPAFWEAMSTRTYQRSGAEFLSMTGHCADFSEPGLGKSATSLAALIQAGVYQNGRHLVIVSNKTAIRSTWRREINKWCPDAKVYPMPEGWQKRQQQFDRFWADETGPRFLICLPHMLQIKREHWCKKCEMWANGKKINWGADHYGDNHKVTLEDKKLEWPDFFYDENGKPFEWDSIIADECHDYLLKMRPPTGKTPMPQWAVGMTRIKIKQGGVKLAITGTPMRGKEMNLFGILYFLDSVRFSSFWGWAGTYFSITENEYVMRGGGGAKGVSNTVGNLKPEMEKAFYDVLDSLSIRRTKAEVRKDLPAQMPMEVWVPLEGEHERQYREFEAMGEVALEGGFISGLGTLSELTRLKQLSFGPWDVTYPEPQDDEENLAPDMFPLVAQSPKIDKLLDMLGERDVFDEPRNGMKYIISSQYTRIISGLADLLRTKYDIPVLEITGKITGRTRDLAVSSFQSQTGPRVLLMNTKAGGSSLTLDAWCDEMFILDETWVHDDQVQLMGRIDNRGDRISPRMYWFFRTEGTIEEGIAMTNDDQNTMQSKILDGRRGNTYALSLLRRRAE